MISPPSPRAKFVATPIFGAAGIALLYAAIASLWILGSGLLLTFAVPDPGLQSRIELAKGLGFVAVTSTLLYLLLARWHRSVTQPAAGSAEFSAALNRRVIGLLIALALVVPLIGWAIVAVYSPQAERRAYSDLQAVAELKAAQIGNWMAERDGDSAILAADKVLAAHIGRLLRQEPQTALPEYLVERLGSLRQNYGYESILLLDADGGLLYALGEHSEMGSTTRNLLRQSLASKRIQRGDLYRETNGDVHIDWVVPLLESGPSGERAAAAIVLRVAAANFLFPLIQRWPGMSPSAETLLVRREGETVRYLNSPRHAGGAALSKRHALADAALPAAVAARAAKPGTTQGKDDRGIPVLAAYRPVPGTAWHIVAKIDRDEVLAPLWELVLWVSVLAVLAFLAIGVALLALWRQQQRAQALSLQLHTAKADRLLQQFFDLPFIGMAMTSPASKHWLRYNDRLCSILGYSREELANKSWAEMTHPEDIDADIAEFERVMRGEAEGYAMDKRFIRPDGAIVYASIDVKAVRRADGDIDYFVATVQDITERKLAETALARQKDLYRMLSETNQAIVRITRREALFPEVCRIAVSHGRFAIAWIGMIDKDRQQLIPVAQQGEDAGYARPIGLGPGAAEADARRPAVQAIHSGESVIENDIRAEADAPWRDAARRAGVRSTAAFPIHERGVAAGAIVLAARESGYFSEDLLPTLEEMAIDISFALDNFENEAELARSIAALRASERGLREAQQLARVGSYVYDIRADNWSSTAMLDEIFGIGADYARNEAGWTALIHPDEREPMRAYLRRLIAERDHFEREYRIVRAGDGVERWVLGLGNLEYSASGEPLRLIGSIQDITERKRAELELREQLDELRRWHEATLGRETRILDLKREVNALLQRIGEAPRYPSAQTDTVEEN